MENFVIIGILFSILTVAAEGSGVVDIHLVSFTSKDGQDESGTCCESYFSTSNCDPCDPYIEISLVDNNKPSQIIGSLVTTDISSNTNNVTFGDSFHSTNTTNPFNLPFKMFSTFLKVIFKVMDDDQYDARPSTPDNLADIEYPVGHGEPAPFSSHPVYTLKHLDTKHLSISFEYRIMCDVYYYGDCDVYCKPDVYRYTCNNQGRKVCIKGWSGVKCTIPPASCSANQCKNGATCVPSGTGYSCVCPVLYQGNFCENLKSTLPPTKKVTLTSSKSTAKPLPRILTTTVVVTTMSFIRGTSPGLTSRTHDNQTVSGKAATRQTSETGDTFFRSVGIIAGSSALAVCFLSLLVWGIVRCTKKSKVSDDNYEDMRENTPVEELHSKLT